MTHFGSSVEVFSEALDILRPAAQMSVSENAADKVVLKSAAIAGPFNPELSHLMSEPANLSRSREFDSIVLVAPAQIGKTQSLVLNVMADRIANNPTDMMLIEKSQGDARDFSATRFDRMIQDSPMLQPCMVSGKGKDNVYDKWTKAGTIIRFAHPSKNALAGKPVPLMLMTDYDRYQDNIGKEGGVFEQAAQRPKSFMSKGMVIAESTPARPVIDPKWVASEGSHEAPPTSGILGLYNTGDRRIAYGQCPHCDDYFIPNPNPDLSLWVPEHGSPEERADQVCLKCVLCGGLIEVSQEREFRASGAWVKEGQGIDRSGNLIGLGRQSKRASFWVSGWFASFNSWSNLALTYIRAKEDFELNGLELSLQNTCNQMFASPYIEQARRSEVQGFEKYKERAIDTPKFHVPEGVRVIITSVDVQGGAKARFEVLRTGFGKGNRTWPMDRFALVDSKRGGRIDPSTMIEDWDILTDLSTSTLKLGGDQELMNHILCVDCGGEDGVYDRALDWYRELSFQAQDRVWLVKGDSKTFKASQSAPLVNKTMPDSTKRSGSKVSSTGDVPVLMVNTHRLKDMVYNDLQRDEDGNGFVTFSSDFKDAHYEELFNAEVRGSDGWDQIRGKANETFDLFTYARAVWHHIGGHEIDWLRPPIWAAEMDTNSNVITKGVRQTIKSRPRRRVRNGG